MGIVKRSLKAASAGLLAALCASAALAEDGTYKGRLPAVGANCRGGTHFDVEAMLVGDKLEGTLMGSNFRGPAKFAGSATPTSFNATLVFQNLNNLRSDIAGTRTDAETYAVTVKFNGGGPSNCEATGPVKKG
jgi:hypothetical protein